jgi:molecular chaperone DnaK (HSP70)
VAEHHTPLIEMCDYDEGPDITATSLCIKLADGQLVTLLPTGSTLPMSRLFYLTTSTDSQTTATLQFFKDDIPCNRSRVEGLTPRPRGTTRVKVLARCDRFRETTVIIQELGSWEKTMVTLERMRTIISHPANPIRSFQWSESPSFGVDGVIGELPG